MQNDEIRSTFLRFYEERAHRIVPSSSLIPTDPTVLLTIAGMIQFKPYFLGVEPPPFPRAASVQKCFRTENISDVGTNAKDCTFFEMLGNFSFGDYFKRDACVWAWELLTGPFGIDADRLWITVLESDEEAERIWRDDVGVAAGRVLRYPKEDNFWHTGGPGPCGPCTELYIDRGPRYGPDGARGPADVPERYQEIYNLVFMQYVQDEPFHVIGDLERTGVDTGMGLERLAQILQDVPTVFDTDLLRPVVERAQEITGASADRGDADRSLLQILADHSKAVTFLIADGVTPSNEGRGYVLRRVLRRAVTKARRAGVTAPLMRPLSEVVVERFGSTYPELVRAREAIVEIAEREERRFSQTLDAGLEMLETSLASASGGLPGDVAFKLHDTYGFPLEITQDVARDAGLDVDVAEFERLMDEQRERSRRATAAERRGVATLRLDVPSTEFLGYAALTAEARVVAIVDGVEARASAPEGAELDVAFDRSPFYAEGGGQVGDRGWIEGAAVRADVLDTRAVGGIQLHRVRVVSGELRVGDDVRAEVSPGHRSGVERAHTATHMMHHTLRELVGEHVRQMGSLVEPGRLRFDFSHFSAVDRETLDEVEETVNARVLADDPVRWFVTDYRDAVDRLGAIAFFEDKYGDVVRVVEVGDYSRELCGGTHVHQTGRVGLVKLLSEGSIGSNLRRVEALTGVEGLRYVNARLRALERAADLVRVPPDDIEAGVERLLRAQKELQRSLEEAGAKQAGAAVSELIPLARETGRGSIVVARRSEDVGVLRKLAQEIRDKLPRAVVILGTAGPEQANMVGAASKALVAEGLDARAILRAGSEHIGGGAGGKPDLAMAGGRKPEGLDRALEAARAEAEVLLR